MNSKYTLENLLADGLISLGAWSLIDCHFSEYAKETLVKVVQFVLEECIPAEELHDSQISNDPSKRWKTVPTIVEELKMKAKQKGLWNLFLSQYHYPKYGVKLSNLEYAIMAEFLGRGYRFASEAMNCSAPDSGNIEVLAKYGNEEQQQLYLQPLLNGDVRSAFSMTERFVSSSDATNINTSIKQEGDEIVINGHKWWISGAGDPRCKFHIVFGRSNTQSQDLIHSQHSIVIVPADTPGVKVVRHMLTFGFDGAPEGRCEVTYTNVRIPLKNLILGWGKGFEIIQGRLGPGRIHHCMRSIGYAERALEYMIKRATDPERKPFGKLLKDHGTVIENIAKCRIQIEQSRLLVLSAARMIDLYGSKTAQSQIAFAKVAVLNATLDVVDKSMQIHGAVGVSQDFPLASMWVNLRTLRYADGPDEVHLQQQGKRELKRAKLLWQRHNRTQTRSKDLLIEKHITPRL